MIHRKIVLNFTHTVLLSGATNFPCGKGKDELIFLDAESSDFL